ncbi:pentapeptide repeat-containing protein [Promicromonospora sp. NPDC023987]|uniref:pentapeptide repeat-containing protein n=1 Tax=Promicromonospora sp. NPDC023987 TaxID=3155360 RepID=UPI0033EA06B1
MLGAFFSGVVGTILVVWQENAENARVERAEQVESARQEREEMLGDLTYLRESLRDGTTREFYNLNLRGANLSGLDLGCDVGAVAASDPRASAAGIARERNDRCLIFHSTDFTGADLDHADLTGVMLLNPTFVPASAVGVEMPGSIVIGSILATFVEADLRGAMLRDDDPNPDGSTDIHIIDSVMVGASIDAFGFSEGWEMRAIRPDQVVVQGTQAADTPWADQSVTCPRPDLQDAGSCDSGGYVDDSSQHFPLEEQRKFYMLRGVTADTLDSRGTVQLLEHRQ